MLTHADDGAAVTPRTRRGGLAVQAAALFALLAVCYLASAGLRASRSASITGDEPFYLVTTQSLLDDHDLDLRNQYEFETYRTFFDHPDRLWRQAGPLPDGRLLSPHEPGLSLLILPGFALGGLHGVQIELLLLSALAFALAFVLAAVETRRPRLSWVTVAVTGLTASPFVYATEVYPEMPAALCIVSAVLLLKMRPGAARSLAMVAVLTVLAWLGLKFVIPGIVVAAAYAVRSGGRERMWFGALAAASGALYIGWHLATFDALTPYSSNLVYEGESTAAVVDAHFSFGDRLYRLWGLFIDRRFGVGRWAPVLLLVPLALPFAARRISSGKLVATLVVTQVCVASFVSVTMMGWWFPGRMLMAVAPLFAVALAAGAARAPRGLLAAGGLAAGYSLVVTGLLVRAVNSGEVVVAVDPFAMDAAPFRRAGALFPQYTWWTTETIVLNAVWLAAGAVIAAVLLLRSLRGRPSPGVWHLRVPPLLRTRDSGWRSMGGE